MPVSATSSPMRPGWSVMPSTSAPKWLPSTRTSAMIWWRSRATSAFSRKAKLAETQHEIQQEEKALQVIEKDQARMRDNMARVPPTSEAYKRYLQKFDVQETEIEKGRERITKLQNRAEEERKAYES